jgi:hypothetical protein
VVTAGGILAFRQKVHGLDRNILAAAVPRRCHAASSFAQWFGSVAQAMSRQKRQLGPRCSATRAQSVWPSAPPAVRLMARESRPRNLRCSYLPLMAAPGNQPAVCILLAVKTKKTNGARNPPTFRANAYVD